MKETQGTLKKKSTTHAQSRVSQKRAKWDEGRKQPCEVEEGPKGQSRKRRGGKTFPSKKSNRGGGGTEKTNPHHPKKQRRKTRRGKHGIGWRGWGNSIRRKNGNPRRREF